MIPLPFAVQLERYTDGVTDSHGNPTDSWGSPETVSAAFWVVSSQEPAVAGHDRVIVDAAMFVASTVMPAPRDRVTITQLGGRFEVIGYAENYDHGPFGFKPGRVQVNLKRVEG